MSTKGIVRQIIACFLRGNKVLLCGNGGSAAMSQHMAAEFVCKFEHDRRPLPAIALTTDTSILTSIANDFTYERVFERQIRALGRKDDILLVFSTSGQSTNCLWAIQTAKQMDIEVIEMPIVGDSTAHIQEDQFKKMHDICRLVEQAFI